MKSPSTVAAIAAGLFAIGTPASAATITFDVLPTGSVGSGSPIVDGAYTLTYNAGSGGFANIDAPASCTPACTSSGSNAFYSFNSGSITVTRTDSAAFSLASLDAAQTFTTLGRVLDFNITGVTTAATTVSQSFVTAPGAADSFQTFLASVLFANLTSLTISGNGVYPTTEFAIDNLVVDAAAVPEPATWAMLVLGFAGVGLVMRRRPTVVAV